MKKILVNGYFGINFGDDLFFKILFDRYNGEVNFYFYNNSYLRKLYKKYKEIFRDVENVKVLRYNRIRKVFEKLNCTRIINHVQFNKYDATVFIGGSIFMQNETWQITYKEKKDIIEYFSSNNKNIFILGSNFGPFTDNNFKIKYNNVFNKCSDICFREKFSYDQFKDLENVRFAPDIVFKLKAKKIKKEKNSIGVSLIEINERKDLEKYRTTYIDKIRDIVEVGVKQDKNFTFFSFSEVQGDMKIINEVCDGLKDDVRKKVKIVNYTGDIDRFLEEFEKMENIIGTRFHACILSQVFGQGLYPIIYSDKTYNVLKDIKLDSYYKYIRDIESLDVKEILSVLPNNKLTNSNIFKQAEEQFKGLDKYVRS